MENASKALMIAGTVLVSFMVLAVVVFMYNRISAVQQTKNDTEESMKLKDYSLRFEQYNKVIYGSELLSLANLRDDYNKKQAEEQGYTPVEIKVVLDKEMKEYNVTYITAGEHTIQQIRQGISNLEVDIGDFEDDNKGVANKVETGRKRSIKYYAQLTNRQIATLFKVNYDNEALDYEIEETLKNTNTTLKNLLNNIEKYKILRCIDIKYDANGRVCYMKFEVPN